MLARIRARLSYANVMATIAVFLALGGTSAYAINEWTGANILDSSLTGADVKGKQGNSTTAAVNGSLKSEDVAGQQANAANGSPFIDGTLTQWDIKNNSLTGSDVLESSLAKVPDADKLDGIDSTGFVQGRGTSLSNRLVFVPAPPPGTQKTLIQIPGLGELEADCTAGQGARIFWHNTSSSIVDVWVYRQAWFAHLFGPNTGIDVANSDLGFPGGKLSLGLGNDPGARRLATLDAFAFQTSDGAPCGFQVQGTLWVSP